MRRVPITVTCDCGVMNEVAYGEKWHCDSCGRTWDTNQISQADYDAVVAPVRRYRLLVLGPPVVLAVILVPLSIYIGLQFAFLLFVLVMAHGLLVVPQIRKRTSAASRASATAWKLSPE